MTIARIGKINKPTGGDSKVNDQKESSHWVKVRDLEDSAQSACLARIFVAPDLRQKIRLCGDMGTRTLGATRSAAGPGFSAALAQY